MRPGAVHWQKLWSIVAALPMLLNGCGTNKTVLEEIVEQVYPIALNTDLSIHNRDGAVLVYGSDGNELRVRSAEKAYIHERGSYNGPGNAHFVVRLVGTGRVLSECQSGAGKCMGLFTNRRSLPPPRPRRARKDRQ